MKRWLFPTIIMLAVSVGIVWSTVTPGHADARSSAPAADGRTLYVTHCASCHGTSGRGDGPVADSLRRRPSDLTQFAKTNGGVFPSAKMHRIIDGREVGAHGSVEMPVWGDVFMRTREGDVEARIDAIVRFLESIQERTGH